jgi:uncharacterized protein (TIGR03546 family)
MLSGSVALLRRISVWLLAYNAPAELAAGFTLGMIIGLVPKGNLIAVSLWVLLFSLRVNKGLGLLAVVIVTSISGALDSFAHKLGDSVLHAQSLQFAYASISELPLVPWLNIDNTVVTGALLLGLYFAYPVYWVTRTISARITPEAAA